MVSNIIQMHQVAKIWKFQGHIYHFIIIKCIVPSIKRRVKALKTKKDIPP